MKSREDWLCDQLDREDLSEELRAKYEAELNTIAERYTKSQEAARAKKAADAIRFAAIKEQLLAGNTNVIDAFGIPEFGEDYEISCEGANHVVYSRVAGDDQNNRHLFKTFDEANSKFRKLVWD